MNIINLFFIMEVARTRARTGLNKQSDNMLAINKKVTNSFKINNVVLLATDGVDGYGKTVTGPMGNILDGPLTVVEILPLQNTADTHDFGPVAHLQHRNGRFSLHD